MVEQWRPLPVEILTVRCRRCHARYVEAPPLVSVGGPSRWRPVCGHRWRSAECWGPLDPRSELSEWGWRRPLRRWFYEPLADL